MSSAILPGLVRLGPLEVVENTADLVPGRPTIEVKGVFARVFSPAGAVDVRLSAPRGLGLEVHRSDGAQCRLSTKADTRRWVANY